MSRTTDIEDRTTARRRVCVAGLVNRSPVCTWSVRAHVHDLAARPGDASDGGFVSFVDAGVTGR